MERFFEQGLLYDFYGELLTEHQRRIYEDAVYQNLSLGEIAEEAGISRQAVHDLIRRCDRILADYEKKLHLVQRFLEAKKTVGRMMELTGEAAADAGPKAQEALSEMRALGSRLLEEL